MFPCSSAYRSVLQRFRSLALASVVAAACATFGAIVVRAQALPIAYWVFEDVAAVPPIPNCTPGVGVNGYDVDPADRPVISWSENNPCSGATGATKVYWSRKDAGVWQQTTFEPNKLYPGGGDTDFAHAMALAPDGTPWMVFDAIAGLDFYSAHETGKAEGL